MSILLEIKKKLKLKSVLNNANYCSYRLIFTIYCNNKIMIFLFSPKTFGFLMRDTRVFSYFLHNKINNLSLKTKYIELEYTGCLDFLFF